MFKVAGIGDRVLFSCGVRNIIQGSPRYVLGSRPNARIGDKVSCGGVIIKGSSRFVEAGSPISRFSDKAICPHPCNAGTIISGATREINT